MSYSRLTLLPTGRYEWSVPDDTEDSPEAGTWNFELIGPRDGILRLGREEADTAIALFSLLPDGKLDFRREVGEYPRYVYSPCQMSQSLEVAKSQRRTAGSRCGDGRTAAELPAVPLPASLAELRNTAWKRVSRPDDRGAQSMAFDNAGSIVIEVPRSECDAPGHAYLYGPPLPPERDGSCRERAPYDPYDFRRVGRFLEHRSELFLPVTEAGSERYLFLDFRNAGVAGALRYTPPLARPSSPLAVELWASETAHDARGSIELAWEWGRINQRERKVITVMPVEGRMGLKTPIVSSTTADLSPPAGQTSLTLAVTYESLVTGGRSTVGHDFNLASPDRQ